MERLSDESLMLRSAAGDEAAFALLVERYQDQVRRFTRSLLGDVASSDEAAQEIYLKLWVARTRYRSADKFRQLLFTIARHHCLSVLRWRSVRRLVGLESLEGGEASDERALHGEDELVSKETEELVRRALAKLPERFRTPLVLRFVEDLSYECIAGVIGRTPSAARSRVHYGLKQLASLLPPEVAPWID